jgi:hypothetical protein
MMLLGGGSGGVGADIKVFEIMVHKLRKEFKNRFTSHDDLEDCKKNIMEEIEKVNEHDGSIQENTTKYDYMKQQLENMVDKKDLKYEFDRLHSTIRQLKSQMASRTAEDGDENSPLPEFDNSSLGPIEDKILTLEENINELRIQMKTSEEKLKLECRDLKLNKYDYSTGKEVKNTVDKLLSHVEEVDSLVKE